MERFSESDCPSCCVPVPVDLMPDGDLVRYADAQATIAALQARLEAHERAYQEGHPTPCTLGSYCPYCEIERRVAQLTQRTAERDTARRRVNELEAREVDVVLLREDLEQRTAELERVRDQYADLRKMVLALPKVEGEIRVIEVATDEWHVYDTIFATKAGADNYAALLQHRQGMEG